MPFCLKILNLILNIICRATENKKDMLILLLIWRVESIQSGIELGLSSVADMITFSALHSSNFLSFVPVGDGTGGSVKMV